MKSFYNTNKETGETLKRSKKKALTQQEIILEWMQRHRGKSYSPHFLHQLLFGDDEIPTILEELEQLFSTNPVSNRKNRK